MRLDLHMHSDRSDGRFPAEQVLAQTSGLDVVALTDHDWPHDGDGTHVLGAAEVTGRHDGHELHLLVYFAGPVPTPYAGWLRGQAATRTRRYAEVAQTLALPMCDAPSPTRAHLARALHAQGLVAGYRAAFPWMAARGIGPFLEVSFTEVITTSRDAGAYTSWAHPSLAHAQAYTRTFASAGLHALEAVRPGLDRTTRKGLRKLTTTHHLAVTGGSDWHGWHEPPLGLFSWQGEDAEAFLRRIGA